MMTMTIPAIYENGVFNPLTPLSLPDKTRVEVLIQPAPTSGLDPVFDLIGAYQSERPLIDDIPVSEDPDLYLVVEQLGEQAEGRHAWEIAPARYAQGPDGRPVRRE
jgi:predicted DNA-binding antitoxin AbrB/MazE fold protein